jgi:hypothetical protein
VAYLFAMQYAEPDESTTLALPGAVWDGEDGKAESDGLAAGGADQQGKSAAGAGTEITSASGADAGGVNDFSRGKRLKKLLRLLNSKAAQQAVVVFKYRMLLLVLGIVMLHIACFASVMLVLKSTHTVLTELRAAGERLHFFNWII